MLPYTFWQDVEKPMKHVLYGDSIGSKQHVCIQHKSKHCILMHNLQFDEVWEYLTDKLNREVIVDEFGKERIFDLHDIQIQSYFEQEDRVKAVTPKYIMRHHISDEVVKLNLHNGKSLVSTKKHSMFVYDGNTFKVEDAEHVDYLPSVTSTGLVYCEDQFNDNMCTLKESINKQNIKQSVKPIKVMSKDFIQYDDYVFDFEVEGTHNFVVDGIVVHNTDSIFINIPLQDDQDADTESMVKIANDISQEINDRIVYCNESMILPKLGTHISHNETFFKTELVADAIMFLDIKKNYAYRMLADNGRVLPEAEFVYKGIPVVKSNVAPLSKKLIRMLVENLALNSDIPNIEITSKLTDIARTIWQEVQDCVKNGEFDQFATPSKWAGTDYKKDTFVITSMKMYNALAQDDIFTPLSPGLIFPVKVNPAVLSKAISASSSHPSRSEVWMSMAAVSSDIKHFCVPYDYDPNTVFELMKKGGVVLDPKLVYTAMYSKVAHRIKDTLSGMVLK